MAKIVQLDYDDIRDLLYNVLSKNKPINEIFNRQNIFEEEEPQQIATNKTQLMKQLRQDIASMSASKDLGVIVSLFLFILTDKSSEMVLRSLSRKLQDHIHSGGNSVDFTKKMSGQLKPLTKNFVRTLQNLLDKEVNNVLSEGKSAQELYLDLDDAERKLNKLKAYEKRDPEIVKNPKYQEKVKFFQDTISEIKDEMNKSGEGINTTKNKLRTLALQRVQKMTSNSDVMEVFSIFLEFLTDPDTTSDLKQLGAVYGKELNKLISTKPQSWTERLLNQLRNPMNKLLSTMVENMGVIEPEKQDKTDGNKDEKGKGKDQDVQAKIQTDIESLKDISKRYNL